MSILSIFIWVMCISFCIGIFCFYVFKDLAPYKHRLELLAFVPFLVISPINTIIVFMGIYAFGLILALALMGYVSYKERTGVKGFVETVKIFTSIITSKFGIK